MKQTLHTQLSRMATDRWARNGLRTLLRACWIAVCLCCIGLGGSLVWGWPLRIEWLGAAALGCIGVALALLLRPPMRPAEAARRLDRRFGLNEELSTAVEVAARNPQPGSVASHLVQHASLTVHNLHQEIRRRQRPPWIELFTLLALCLAAVGLLLLSGFGSTWTASQLGPLPPLPRAADPADLFAEEPPAPQDGVPGAGDQLVPGEGDQLIPGEGEPGTGADPRVLSAVADALRDQGATRPAAEALDRGDPNAAAQELRELADQASQLSPSSRGDLADNLRNAARQIEQIDPQTAEQLRDSASGLEGSTQQASRALDSLAEALDRMGQSAGAGQSPQQAEGGQNNAGQQGGQGEGPQDGAGPQGQGQAGGIGNAPGGQQRPVQPERLGVDGQAVELSAEGSGQSAAESRQQGMTMPGGTGSTTGGDPRHMGAVGPDPLRIPLDERDVVQEYFNP